MSSSLSSRQTIVEDDNRRYFWWSDRGQLIRWGIFTGIFVLLMLYMTIGYLHAKRRINKGLPPMAYHRWLLSRQQRAIHDPSYRDPMPMYTTYRPQQYGMDAYPPPGYEHSAPPPTYQPPQGGTKIDPRQSVWRTEPTRRPNEFEEGGAAPEYTAPAGPPPAAVLHPTGTGSSSTSNNPYRL